MTRPAALRRGLSGRQTGSVIGAVFGLVYVEANASALGRPSSLVVRIVGASAFVACLLWMRRRLGRAPTRSAEPRRFGLGYRFVVAAEAVVLLAGWYALNGPLDRPEAALPWVTLVVGVHFFALALVFRARVQHLLGASPTLCGASGLTLAVGGAPVSSVVLAAGIFPGFVLLAFSFWGLAGSEQTPATRPSTGDDTTGNASRSQPALTAFSAETNPGAGGQDVTGRPLPSTPIKALASRNRDGDNS